MIFTIFSKGNKGGGGRSSRERSVATTCDDNTATLHTSPTKVDINIFAMMFLFHLQVLFIILNVMNVGVTYAMMVVHPLIRRHHHHPRRQYSFYDRSQRIGTCQLSLLVRKISFHGRNRKSCHSTQIQQQQQQRNNDDDSDNTAIEQPLQLLSEEQVQAQVVEGNNTYYVEREEDDGGLFFLEASRQAERDRQLKLRSTASPSSSSIESGIVDDVYDTEDETKDDSVSDIDPMLANNKTVVVVEEKELKPTEDSESLITGGARDTAVAPTRTENEDLVVTTDDEILQSPPPSETPADNSSSSEMNDDFIAPSENDTVSGETLDIPTIHIPPPFEKEDDDDTVRLSSDGKVNFEPNTNLEGEVNQENVDMGLLVLTRALLTVKSIVDRRQ